jgi:thymidylate kinase
VEWTLLRPGSVAGRDDDVDLLLRPPLGPALTALQRAGYLRVPSWGRGSHSFLYTYEPSVDRWIKLDVVDELAFGRHRIIRTFTEAEVVTRRLRDGNAWVLDPSDEFWALLLHCVLDRQEFPAHHSARLSQLASMATLESPLAQWFDQNVPGWAADSALQAVRDQGWPQLLAAADPIERGWLRRHPDARPRLAARAVLRRSTKLLTVLRRRGLSVALLGPDGAGKSTLARRLRSSFIFPARTVYMGMYAAGREPRAGILGRMADLWRGWLVGLFHRLRGRLVIFDRYTYDALLDGRRQTLRRRIRRYLLAHALPPPHLVIVLDAPAELLYRRSREHGVAGLEEQRQRYLRLAGRVRRLHVVDASRGSDVVRREVTALVWSRYLERQQDQGSSRPSPRAARPAPP